MTNTTNVKKYDNTVRLSGTVLKIHYYKEKVRLVLSVVNPKNKNTDYPEIVFYGELAEKLRKNVTYLSKISIIAKINSKKVIEDILDDDGNVIKKKIKFVQYYVGQNYSLNSIGYSNGVTATGDIVKLDKVNNNLVKIVVKSQTDKLSYIAGYYFTKYPDKFVNSYSIDDHITIEGDLQTKVNQKTQEKRTSFLIHTIFKE